jgi:hypothetical protein
MGAGNADKSFTSWKLDWIDQVMCDTSLSPAERLVLIFIGQCVNEHTLDAKPGLQYCADTLGTSKGAVIRCIERGVAAGHLGVTPGTPGRPGRGHSNHYRMLGKGINEAPFKARQRDSARYPSGQQKGLNSDPERDSKTVEKGITLSPEHLEHLNEHLFLSAQARPNEEKIDDKEQMKGLNGKAHRNRKSVPRSGGSRLPEDWQPSEDDLDFARKILGWQSARIEVDRFRDYWCARPGPRAFSCDWSRTWRNWVRKAAEQKGLSPEPPIERRQIP